LESKVCDTIESFEDKFKNILKFWAMFSFPFLPSLWNLAQTFLPCVFKQGMDQLLQEPNPFAFCLLMACKLNDCIKKKIIIVKWT
jgi:hypothetical protein